MKRSYLKKQSSSPVKKVKREIQALLREIAGIRQGWICWVQNYPKLMAYLGPHDMVFQYDHCNSRARNISYGDSRLGVGVCKRHHWFHDTTYDKKQKAEYDKYMRKFIGAKNRALLKRVEEDRGTHNFTLWEWEKVKIQLKKELEELQHGKN